MSDKSWKVIGRVRRGHRNPRREKQCSFCGGMFMPWKRDWVGQKCCSQECSEAAQALALESAKEAQLRSVTKHGAVGTPTYRSWQSAISRCERPSTPSYKHYGARGIRMCARWRGDFSCFLRDMGPRPTGTTLDRIDPDGNYEPCNCRWATASVQNLNKRPSSKKVTPELELTVRVMRGSGSSRAVAALVGLSHVTVQAIWRGMPA